MTDLPTITPKVRALIRQKAELLKPTERVTVPEAAERHVKLDTGPYTLDVTHYMREPGECLTSRLFRAVIFAGPARTGKTQMLCDGWAAYNIMHGRADQMLVFPVADLARKFSTRRMDRMHRYSPDLRAQLGEDRGDDNIGEKKYKAGNVISFTSPTKNTLAMQDLSMVGLSDYDRYDDDIGGDGPAFNMGYKRTETSMSKGMTMAESSPSKPITDAHWRLSKERPHEAPPSLGIMGLYNEGDRRRLYGQCQRCGEYWMQPPAFENVYLPTSDECPDPRERVANFGLICPTCECLNTLKDEQAVKRSAVWLKEGQTINKYGEKEGDGISSKYASFWMPGWHAAFLGWTGLVENYIKALERLKFSSDEGGLKVVTNIDCGAPYLEKSRVSIRTAKSLQDRSETDLEKRVVPNGVRYLITTIDCQKHAFVVQTQGFGVDFESWMIDRYSITTSTRFDDNGDVLLVEPAVYKEDWNLLEARVIDRTYRTEDGREMTVKQVGLDMHGVPGTTPNAYAFWRKMKKKGKGGKFRLLRGDSTKQKQLVRQTYPEQPSAANSDKKVAGDVPVLQLSTDLLKDIIAVCLDRDTPGAGYIHFPSWLPDSFYDEAVAETRTDKGWIKDHEGVRNETLDLLVYARALTIDTSKPYGLAVDKVNWDSPPSWAALWDKNSSIVITEEEALPRKKFRQPNRQINDPYL